MKKLLLFILLFSFIATTALAHPGRTDKNGCHKDNKRGGKHCH